MLIKFSLQMWMRNASRAKGSITDNVEYNLLAEAVRELSRLEDLEFWVCEFLVRPTEANKEHLKGLVNLDLLEQAHKRLED